MRKAMIAVVTAVLLSVAATTAQAQAFSGVARGAGASLQGISGSQDRNDHTITGAVTFQDYEGDAKTITFDDLERDRDFRGPAGTYRYTLVYEMTQAEAERRRMPAGKYKFTLWCDSEEWTSSLQAPTGQNGASQGLSTGSLW